MRKKPQRKGFTLIELSLSMIFVALLALAIALVIRDTVMSYRRGLTLNQINTVGMDIVDDIRAAVQNSQSKSLLGDCLKYYYSNADPQNVEGSAYWNCTQDQGYNFVYWVKTENIVLDKGTSAEVEMKDVPIYGAFCTGAYSYIWNSGYFETENTEFYSKTTKEWARLKYKMAGDTVVTVMGSLRDGSTTPDANGEIGMANKPFRLLKVRDDRRGVCAGVIRKTTSAGDKMEGFDDYTKADGVLPDDFDGMFDMTTYMEVDAKEPPVDIIITDKTYDLAIYDLFAARPAVSSTQKNMFYSASFILGTIDGGINITAHGKSCAAPSDYETENYDYCSINKFSFAAQSGIE